MFALKGSVAPLTHVALRPPTSRARTVRTFAVGKKELVERVTERAGSMSKADVETVVVALIEEIKASVIEGEKVSVLGFGTFQGKDRAARNGRNPKTGEPLTIAATRAPTFTPAKSFKDEVKEQYLKENP